MLEFLKCAIQNNFYCYFIYIYRSIYLRIYKINILIAVIFSIFFSFPIKIKYSYIISINIIQCIVPNNKYNKKHFTNNYLLVFMVHIAHNIIYIKKGVYL